MTWWSITVTLNTFLQLVQKLFLLHQAASDEHSSCWTWNLCLFVYDTKRTWDIKFGFGQRLDIGHGLLPWLLALHLGEKEKTVQAVFDASGPMVVLPFPGWQGYQTSGGGGGGGRSCPRHKPSQKTNLYGKNPILSYPSDPKKLTWP